MSRRKSRSTGAVFGIDLGTTYSCLATVNASGAPEVVPLLDGSLTLPSVVLFLGADDCMTG
ncbi:MAG: Hsp70 family protein, partial [Actinomycetota bacterium]|nr:Hsp70 family protein [Actinomycetota bacterium]